MFTGSDPEALTAITEQLGRLKHDLGKYIFFRQRWLPADADADARKEALAVDLLCTRSGPSGTTDAIVVWQGFRATLSGEVGGRVWAFEKDEDGGRLFACMEALEIVVLGLRGAGCVDPVEASALCCEVSDRIRSLHRRARAALQSG